MSIQSFQESLTVVSDWVCVLFRTGGFRPCRVQKVRTRFGSDQFCRIVDFKPVESKAAEAEDMAEMWAVELGLPYKQWP